MQYNTQQELQWKTIPNEREHTDAILQVGQERAISVTTSIARGRRALE
jgi:hypothetical protein